LRSEADSDSHHIEEGPEASPAAGADVPPTPAPSPFVGDQGAGDEVVTQLKEGEIQGEKDVPGSSGIAEPPKKKLRIILSSAAAPTIPSQAPATTEAELFKGLDDIPLPDSATMAEIGFYGLELAASEFRFDEYGSSEGTLGHSHTLAHTYTHMHLHAQ